MKPWRVNRRRCADPVGSAICRLIAVGRRFPSRRPTFFSLVDLRRRGGLSSSAWSARSGVRSGNDPDSLHRLRSVMKSIRVLRGDRPGHCWDPVDFAAQDDADAAPERDLGRHSVAWKSLFDGKSLQGWEVVKGYDYEDQGKVDVQDGCLVIGTGRPATGVRWTEKFPKTDYEIELGGQAGGGERLLLRPVVSRRRWCVDTDPWWMGRRRGRSVVHRRQSRGRERDRHIPGIQDRPVVSHPCAGDSAEGLGVSG